MEQLDLSGCPTLLASPSDDEHDAPDGRGVGHADVRQEAAPAGAAAVPAGLNQLDLPAPLVLVPKLQVALKFQNRSPEHMHAKPKH